MIQAQLESVRSRPALWLFGATWFVSVAFDLNVYVAGLAHVYVHDACALVVGVVGVVLAVRNHTLVGNRRTVVPLVVLTFVLVNTIVLGAFHYVSMPGDLHKLFWLEHGDAIRIVGELFLVVWTFAQLRVDRDMAWFLLSVAVWGVTVSVAWMVAFLIARNTPHTTTTTLDLDVLVGLPLAVLFAVRTWPPRGADLIRLVLLAAGSTFLYSRATMVAIGITVVGVLIVTRSVRKAGVALASIAAGWVIVLGSSLILYGSTSLVATTFLRLQSIGNTQLAPYTIPNREAIWRDALRIWKRSPVVGVGYHDYFIYSTVTEIKAASAPEPNDLFSSRIKSAHNDYLSWLSEMGIVGLGILIAFYGTALGLAIAHWRRESDQRLRAGYAMGLILAFLTISIFGEVLIPRTPDSTALAMIWWIFFATLFSGAAANQPGSLRERAPGIVEPTAHALGRFRI